MNFMINYNCSICTYTTTIKANYNRHIKLKHSENKEKFKCDCCDGTYTSEYFLKKHKVKYCKGKVLPPNIAFPPPNVALSPPNVALSPPNVALSPPNIAFPPPNIALTNKLMLNKECICELCMQEFSRSDSLLRHSKICNGTANPLECHLCHVIFPNSYSKSRHLKLCSALVIKNNNIDSNIVIPSNINENTMINTQNNIVTNVMAPVNCNNNNNNTYIITFNTRERINFNTDHITPNVIEDLIKNSMTADEYTMNKDILSGFAEYLLKEIINQCVIKSNSRSTQSKIHVGSNKWKQQHDSQVYDKFLTDITEKFIELLNLNKQTIKVSKFFINNLDNFLNYMADKGYCSEDKTTANNVLKAYRQMLQRLKVIVSEYSSDD
jgi:hypothetical protein